MSDDHGKASRFYIRKSRPIKSINLSEIYSRNKSELPEFRINTSKLRAQIEILSDLVVPYENELIHTIVSLRNISKANCSKVTFRK